MFFPPPVRPCQVVGGRVAAVQRPLRTRGAAEADGALRPHRVGRGTSSSPCGVQTPPQAEACGALQPGRAVRTGLGRRHLGRGLLLSFTQLMRFPA